MTPEHWALLRTKHAPPLRVHPILRTQLELRTPWPLFEWQQRLSLILGVRVGTHLGGPGGLRINDPIQGTQRQNRDVSSATRSRKELAEPGISEQPLIRRLGEFTQGSRGACPQLLTPQSPTSNLPHVLNTARELSAQSQHTEPPACLRTSGLCPWCRSRVRAARRGAARAQWRLGMSELRGRQTPAHPRPKGSH